MKVVKYKELKERFGVPYSRVHLWRMMKDKKFPQSIQLGQNCIVWAEDEVEQWLKNKAGNRNAAA